MQKNVQNIILRISRDDEQLGVVFIDTDNAITYSDLASEIIKDVIALALREGVPSHAAEYKDNSHMIIEKTITPAHPLFPLALVRFLEEKGFHVDRRYPDVEAEITKLLNIFPDLDKNKKEILEKLDTMSYLEQSAILEELKKS